MTTPGKYFDGQGLFLRVAKNGARKWVQRITIRRKRCELGLGSPPAVPLATTRKLALENCGIAMLGGDPLAQKRKAREGITFAAAVDRYLETKLTEFSNEKHRKQWRATLDRYASLGVQSRHLVDRIDDESIWIEKTETAKRLRGRIENVPSWATVAGHRAGDNLARLKRNLSEMLPKPAKVAKTSNQPAMALSDVSRKWVDLAERDGMAAKALQCLTLTAARSGEVRGMAWDEVELGDAATSGSSATQAVWSIPADRMKNGRPHRVPLTQEAVALLSALPRRGVPPCVFLRRVGECFQTWQFLL